MRIDIYALDELFTVLRFVVPALLFSRFCEQLNVEKRQDIYHDVIILRIGGFKNTPVQSNS